ncbi:MULTISPECIES: transposase [unclassified Janthinobacterium]|uniref:transposase n=1 Tax=unclassified Janthinobacterium TaxID=2610881 RepID=UPI0016222B7C|nr:MULTISPECIES: transposase [unclassified Janthinobacterium]MBB5608679.1 putative transposase [Janthinobacterium sp. S3T4]MBB5613918.1 putative transposase [Janthinobacterium sp. S3M3]
MARIARLFLPGMPLHVIQRGADRQLCFFETANYLWYLQQLQRQAMLHGCLLHAYVLMSNHVHLLLSAESIGAVSGMMKALGQEYAHYINWRRRRTGPLWDGRYKSCVVQDVTYLLICQRYIELNPVRARMVNYAGHYRWSSYRCNAEGRDDALIHPHPLYLSMGSTPGERQQAYAALFQADEEMALQALRAASRSNAVVGSAEFVRKMQNP